MSAHISDVQKFIKNIKPFDYMTLRERSWKYPILFVVFKMFKLNTILINHNVSYHEHMQNLTKWNQNAPQNRNSTEFRKIIF